MNHLTYESVSNADGDIRYQLGKLVETTRGYSARRGSEL
jgi:hypothetical protein